MKRMITLVFSISGLATVAMLAPRAKHHLTVLPAVHAQSGCSNATLSGNYGITFSGFQLQSGKSVPFYGVGSGTFDGKGNFIGTFAYSQNGALPGDVYVASTNNHITGTYAVNTDCTGLATATPGSGGDNFAFVIVDGGREVLETDISDPDTMNLVAKKISGSAYRDSDR